MQRDTRGQILMAPVPVAFDIADGHAIALGTSQRPDFHRADAVRRGVQVALRRFEVAASSLRAAGTAAGTGRGATYAFHTALFLFSSRAIFAASLPFFGTTCTKPLWMKSVSIPFLANFFGSGSDGSVAATSTLAPDGRRGKPEVGPHRANVELRQHVVQRVCLPLAGRRRRKAAGGEGDRTLVAQFDHDVVWNIGSLEIGARKPCLRFAADRTSTLAFLGHHFPHFLAGVSAYCGWLT